MNEQLDAEVLERALPDPPDQVRLRVRGDRVHDRRNQEQRDDDVERADVVLLDPLVDRRLGQGGRGEGGRGRGHERHEHRDDAPPVRPEQLGQAAKLPTPAGGLAQATADVVEPAHSPTAPSVFSVRNTWSGMPFSTISR